MPIFATIIYPNTEFGTFLVPCTLEQDENGQYKIEKILNKKNIESYNLNDCQLDIVNTYSVCTDFYLIHHFSRQATTMSELAKECESCNRKRELIENHIQQKMYHIANLLRSGNVDVYLKNGNSNSFLPDDDKVEISPEFINSTSVFQLSDNGMCYSMYLTVNDRKIDVDTSSLFIYASPCVLLFRKVLYISKSLNRKRAETIVGQKEIKVKPELVDKYMNEFVINTLRKGENVKASGFDIIYNTKDINPEFTITSSPLMKKEALLLEFKYGLTSVKIDETDICHVDMNQSENGTYTFVVTHRNQTKEISIKEKMKQFGLMESGKYLIPSNGLSLKKIITNNGIFSTYPIKSDSNINPIIEQDKDNDWFDVKSIVSVRQFNIPFAKLKKNILTHNPVFILPDGSTFIIPDEWFAKYTDIMRDGEEHGDSIRVPLRLIGALDDDSETAKSFITNLKNEPIELPQNIKATLRKYQIEGVTFLVNLYKRRMGGCLADDMGIGKTLQFLTFFLYIYPQQFHSNINASYEWKYANREPTLFDQALFDKVQPLANKTIEHNEPIKTSKKASIVVVPTSLLFNWENELMKFAPSLSYFIYYGNGRNKYRSILPKKLNTVNIVFTSYSILSRDIDILSVYDYECIVLDESQAIKNPSSQNYAAAMLLTGKCRFVMTGTPIENSLTDLWAQMNFINPGLLGSRNAFEKQYSSNSDEDETAHLQRLIHPFILRRTKEQVCKDLPSITRQTIWCDMDDILSSAYERLKSAERNHIIHIDKNIGEYRTSIFSALMRLRLAANDPRLLVAQDKDKNSSNTIFDSSLYNEAHSPKRDEILDRIVSLSREGHKVLLFSNFVTQLELLEKDLQQRNIRYLKLTGGSNAETRQSMVDRFQQDNSITCFLISLKAGGTGLNLTAADYVFILTPWWNAAAEEQAIDRTYRIGQTRPVMVYDFITRNSIEQKMLDLKDRKTKLSQTYIGNNDPYSDINTEDLKNLLDIDNTNTNPA